jgi:hypothetical protein
VGSAYLLDLLKRGGSLHVDYVNLIYGTLDDLGEKPRTSFGDSGKERAGAGLTSDRTHCRRKCAANVSYEAAFKRCNES